MDAVKLPLTEFVSKHIAETNILDLQLALVKSNDIYYDGKIFYAMDDTMIYYTIVSPEASISDIGRVFSSPEKFNGKMFGSKNPNNPLLRKSVRLYDDVYKVEV